MGRSNHLVWRRANAYWRRRLPLDLRRRLGRAEWCLPVGNIGYQDALAKARYLSVMSDELIQSLRAEKPEATPEDLERLARIFFKKKLGEYEQRFVEASAESRAQGEDQTRIADAQIDTLIRVLEGFLRGLPKQVKSAFAHALLADQDLKLPEGLYWTSARLLWRADLAALKVARAHLHGDYSARPEDPVFLATDPPKSHAPTTTPTPMAAPTMTRTTEASSEPSPKKTMDVKASVFFSRYVRRRLEESEDRWTEQTRLQNEMTFRLFCEFTGDAQINTVDEETLVSFKDALRTFPRNWGQNPKYRGLKIKDVIRLADKVDPKKLARISKKTINRHVSALGGAFSDAQRRAEWKGGNPCARLLEKKGRKASGNTQDVRRPYLDNELTRLFRAPVWTGCHSERFWNKPGKLVIKDHRYFIPIIALFTGMREDEICKLCTDDLRQVGKHWAISILENEFGRLKEESSIRLVPVHPTIEASGFIEHANELKKRGRVHLWPKLSPAGPDKKYSHGYQKQFAMTKRAAGLSDKGLTFHSLRHNVALAMKDAGIDLAIREGILGHKSASTTDAVYGAARIHWIERRFETYREAILAIKYQGLELPFISKGEN